MKLTLNCPECNHLNTYPAGNESTKYVCSQCSSKFLISETENFKKLYSIQVKGVSPDAPIVTNEAGGKQSKVEYAFHLCNPLALFKLAEVMQIGADRYERDNWKKIPAEQHYNHLMIHLLAWQAGDKSDDHLGHAMARMMMLWTMANEEEKP